ncbi:HAMP domain-containing sensor histidine kinase [Flavobacterium sp.]|uniref:sensor histidine kinase n=1 Tax=Flavobacterium sp. TaxID=239 RepID=UPI00286AE644|nr:HAMP domain-containing sensor histidine kinase [Flavobacterium sp.]
MFKFSFKNRLAFNFLISTALIVALLFVAIYNTVKYSVYNDINHELEKEVGLHFSEMNFGNSIYRWIDIREWEEKEHNEITIDPVFVQIYDPNGVAVEKSPNLKNDNLKLNKSIKEKYFFDTELNKQFIRQVQVPIYKNGKIMGFLLIAKSLEEENTVMKNLNTILLLSYVIVLFSFFFITRFIAGKSIKPITQITDTASIISTENLKSRIALPHYKDELFVLSKTINDLLDRIENAVEREKQFTSDASHELRTPLAILKGTLEVLVRKPRNQTEYEEKINYCIKEVDRLNHLVDELLLLARFENQKLNTKNESVYLNALILDIVTRYSQNIKEKQLTVKYDFEKDYYINSDEYLVGIIISNLLSNAIKYTKSKGEIQLAFSENNQYLIGTISDTGIGIPKADFDKILNPFYRSKFLEHPEVKGVGLGLSIVNRLCTLLKIEFSIKSKVHVGTTVMFKFPKNS